MLAYNRIVLLVLIFSGILPLTFVWATKVLMKKFEMCDQNQMYKCKYNFTIKTVPDAQYLDGSFVFMAPVDNHIKMNVSVEMLVANQYVYLFSIKERKSCDAMNKYFGEFWYDIERCAQMIPRYCPLPAGRYHLHNCLMNFDKMTTLNNFPFGNLRLIASMYDAKNAIFSCLVVEVENHL